MFVECSAQSAGSKRWSFPVEVQEQGGLPCLHHEVEGAVKGGNVYEVHGAVPGT